MLMTMANAAGRLAGCARSMANAPCEVVEDNLHFCGSRLLGSSPFGLFQPYAHAPTPISAYRSVAQPARRPSLTAFKLRSVCEGDETGSFSGHRRWNAQRIHQLSPLSRATGKARKGPISNNAKPARAARLAANRRAAAPHAPISHTRSVVLEIKPQTARSAASHFRYSSSSHPVATLQ